jgi:hypothetical protein
MRAVTDQHEWSRLHKKEQCWSSSGGLGLHPQGHDIPKFQSISVLLSRRMPEQEAATSEAHGNNDEVSEDKGYL